MRLRTKGWRMKGCRVCVHVCAAAHQCLRSDLFYFVNLCECPAHVILPRGLFQDMLIAERKPAAMMNVLMRPRVRRVPCMDILHLLVGTSPDTQGHLQSAHS